QPDRLAGTVGGHGHSQCDGRGRGTHHHEFPRRAAGGPYCPDGGAQARWWRTRRTSLYPCRCRPFPVAAQPALSMARGRSGAVVRSGLGGMMHRLALYFTAPYRVAVQEEPISAPVAGQVMVQTLVSAISPGTELLFYRGQVPTDLAV